MLVTFDLDGVLQVNPFRRGVFPEVCAKIGEVLVREKGLNASEAARAVLIAINEESRARLRRGDWVSAYDWDEIINLVAERFGSTARFDVAQLVAKYCTADYISSYPDAHEVLKDLERSGIRMAVVTNGYYKYQHPVMEALGLRRFFPDFITPEVTGTVKPDPSIFRAALERVGAYASPALHVGDTIIHDIYGAAKAGLEPVWVVRELPSSLESLSPWERAKSPELLAVIEQAFQSDFCPDAYSGIEWTECRPTYVILRLAELRKVVDHAREQAA